MSQEPLRARSLRPLHLGRPEARMAAPGHPVSRVIVHRQEKSQVGDRGRRTKAVPEDRQQASTYARNSGSLRPGAWAASPHGGAVPGQPHTVVVTARNGLTTNTPFIGPIFSVDRSGR